MPNPPPAPLPGLAEPSPDLPLAGLTLLAVEDSRFSSDALRMMAQRSGARLRRAETLAEAWRHLRVYRPDAVLVDPGLPDGDGLDLVRWLSALGPGAPPALVISGLPVEAEARAAGAAGFLAKPVPSLAAFRQAVLAMFPGRRWLGRHGAEAGRLPAPDPLALREDLARAAGRLARAEDDEERRYLAGFIAGIARTAGDPALAETARALDGGPQSIGTLARALSDRLARGAVPLFAP